jgi:PKD repeat protein
MRFVNGSAIFVCLFLIASMIMSSCKEDEFQYPCNGVIDFQYSGSHADYRLFNFTVTTEGSFESFNWNFGDGTSSAQRDAVHSFPAPGTYTVQCTGLQSCGETVVVEMDVVVSDSFEYRYFVDQIDVSVSALGITQEYSASQDLDDEDGLFNGELRASSFENSSSFVIYYESPYYGHPFGINLTCYPSGSLTAYGFPPVGSYYSQANPATMYSSLFHTLVSGGSTSVFIGDSYDSGSVNLNITRSDSVLIGNFDYSLQQMFGDLSSRSGEGSFLVERIRYYYP